MKPITRATRQADGIAGLARRLSAITGRRVSSQRVWNWVHTDKQVPPKMCIPVEQASVMALAERIDDGRETFGAPVTRYELRPDVFGAPVHSGVAA